MATTQQLADSIAQMEGWNVSGSLAQRNNNPGNLRFVGQAGAVQGQGGFAAFSSPQAGMEALQNQITLDAGRGLTTAQFINKYAPSSENNTSNYLSFIEGRTGLDPNASLQSQLRDYDFFGTGSVTSDVSGVDGADLSNLTGGLTSGTNSLFVVGILIAGLAALYWFSD